MSNIELTNFDIVQYLDNKEIIIEYLSQILTDGNMDELVKGLEIITLLKE